MGEIGAQRAKSHDANCPPGRMHCLEPSPFAPRLLHAIFVHAPMNIEHAVNRVLAHLRGEPGVNQPIKRYLRWKRRILENLVDPRAGRQIGLEIWKRANRADVDFQYQLILDLPDASSGGPNAKLKLRKFALQDLAKR